MALSEQLLIDPEIDANLRAARPVPWGGVVAWVRGSSAIRRLIPTSLALALTDFVYKAAVRVSAGRATNARAAMDAIVGGTSREKDIDALAVEHVAADARGWELTFRPWIIGHLPVRGADEVMKAKDTGRGVLISTNHAGPFVAWTGLGNHVSATIYAFTGDWLAEDPRPGFNGYQLEARRRVLRESKFKFVIAKNSARAMMSLLKSGEIVHLATDLPGPQETQFLGKTVEMQNGTARLAKNTKCIVLPSAIVPDGRRWALQIGKPLDPNDFASAAELHQAIATVHEEFILQMPAHLEAPVRIGGWVSADRTGWRAK